MQPYYSGPKTNPCPVPSTNRGGSVVSKAGGHRTIAGDG